MVDLKQALAIVNEKNKNRYVHVVNEYAEVFQFVMINNDGDPDMVTAIYYTPVVFKNDGTYIDEVFDCDPMFDGEYIQHTI